MAPTPTATNVASTDVLTTTRMLLTNADSETPSTSTTPITAVAATATILAPPVTSQVPERAATSIVGLTRDGGIDRKSTRLNSSHRCISYAVFCLKKKS